MAYRRRQGLSRASTFKEEFHQDDNGKEALPHPTLTSSFSFTPSTSSSSSSSSSSLAAQAIKASAARRDPSLSLAFAKPERDQLHHKSKSCDTYGDVSKSGVWGVLAQKAKEILEDEKTSPTQNDVVLNKLRLIATPHDQEGVESKAGDCTTSPMNLKGACPESSKSNPCFSTTLSPLQQSPHNLGPDSQNIQQTQLKASRDVAMATAAKAKILLRELKTVKADLAFSKARCAQLEEENKILRDRETSVDKGQNVIRADDDLIRLQLETLLAEKGRLASENEVYARENRFLREIVEYHQLTTQDMVYLDEGMEQVTDLYPIDTTVTVNGSRIISRSPRSPLNRPSPSKTIFALPQLLEEDEQEYQDNNNTNNRIKATSLLQDQSPPPVSLSLPKVYNDNRAK